MRRYRWQLLLICFLPLGWACEAPHENGAGSESVNRRAAPVLPVPASVEARHGSFTFDAGTRIVAATDDPDEQWTAKWLAERLIDSSPAAARATAAGAITLALVDSRAETASEGYRLSVAPDGISVEAGDPAGLFYGAVTAWQLVTAGERSAEGIRVPAVRIADSPRFRWRGLMIDSARHFVAPHEMRRMLDWMSLHKLNVLHWHLTDDQGWRLEIPSHPRLTAIGAWRTPARAMSDAAPPPDYGGYYTGDEVREIVAYAARRHITIVPEIEMPGHAQAAIAAYPGLGTGEAPPVSADWGVHDYLFNVEEGTFEVLEDILDEVMTLFPGEFIHVGGDEAVKRRWRESRRVQSRMRDLGIADEAGLQSWFIGRVGQYLDEHGRRLIGWDEILEGGRLAPDAAVMSWRGIEGALEAAAAGHDTVLTPAPVLYFDHRQSGLPGEPPGRGQVVSLADVYAFDPMPGSLAAGERQHVLGIQANLWSEHIRTPERLAHMAFPRAAAVAELAWSPAERRSWPDFLERLAVQLERYRAAGVPFATSAFEARVEAAFLPDGDAVRIALSNQAGFGTIRYSTDGSEITPHSAGYAEPLTLPSSAELSTAVFHDGVLLARTDHGRAGLLAARRYSQQLELCSDRIVLQLEDDGPLDGDRAVYLTDIMNACWTWPRADLSGVRRIDVDVGHLPFNFQPADLAGEVELRAPAHGGGELEIRAGGCGGEVIARLPLSEARSQEAATTLSADVAPDAAAPSDLCLRINAASVQPMWAIERVTLRRDTGGARQ